MVENNSTEQETFAYYEKIQAGIPAGAGGDLGAGSSTIPPSITLAPAFAKGEYLLLLEQRHGADCAETV